MKRRVKRVVTRKTDQSGLFVPAGLFIGLGVGGFYGQIALGALIGLGIGFFLMAIFRIFS